MLRLLKNLFWFAAMVWMGCLLGQVVVPWLTACAPEDDYAAARLLLDDFAGDLTFFHINPVQPAMSDLD